MEEDIDITLYRCQNKYCPFCAEKNRAVLDPSWVPSEIVSAASKVSEFFKKNNVKSWRLMDIRSVD